MRKEYLHRCQTPSYSQFDTMEGGVNSDHITTRQPYHQTTVSRHFRFKDWNVDIGAIEPLLVIVRKMAFGKLPAIKL